MNTFWKEAAKGAGLACLALGVGVGIALADADNSYYSTGNAGSNLSGGDLAVIAGDGETGHLSVVGNASITTSTAAQGFLTMAGGATNTDDFAVYRDFFGTSGADMMVFNGGSESIVFGSSLEDDNGTIFFEFTVPAAGTDDGIYYSAGSDVDDDLLEITSDDVEIVANTGDVVIRMGY